VILLIVIPNGCLQTGTDLGPRNGSYGPAVQLRSPPLDLPDPFGLDSFVHLCVEAFQQRVYQSSLASTGNASAFSRISVTSPIGLL